MQRRKLAVIEDEQLLDQCEPAVADGVPTEVNVFKLGMDDTVKECLGAIRSEFVVLKVQRSQIFVIFYVFFEGWAN